MRKYGRWRSKSQSQHQCGPCLIAIDGKPNRDGKTIRVRNNKCPRATRLGELHTDGLSNDTRLSGVPDRTHIVEPSDDLVLVCRGAINDTVSSKRSDFVLVPATQRVRVSDR